jgi:hypothetical protein
MESVAPMTAEHSTTTKKYYYYYYYSATTEDELQRAAYALNKVTNKYNFKISVNK